MTKKEPQITVTTVFDGGLQCCAEIIVLIRAAH